MLHFSCQIIFTFSVICTRVPIMYLTALVTILIAFVVALTILVVTL